MKKQDEFEAYLNYKKDNYTSKVNAMNLLALEKGLLKHISKVQEALKSQFSADDSRTIREFLEDQNDEVEQCEK